MIPARQSTALELSIGPVLDSSGAAVTDCVVGDFKIKKTTGNFAALNASATLTHVSAGTYDLVLTISDTDTVGLCSIAIDDTTNACAPIYLQVMEEAIYDAIYASSANAFTGAAGSTKVSGVVLTDSVTALAAAAINRAAFAADSGMQTARSNTAQAGANGTITLDTGASSVTNYYLGQIVYITGGTGVGQSRPIISYDGTTKVATVTYDWKTNPDNTSTFAILPPNLFDLHYNALLGDTIDTRTSDISAQIGTAGSGLTAIGDTRLNNLDATVTSRMATYSQPTGFLAATFPTTVASTTNITAASGITVSTNNDKTGYSLAQSFPSNFSSMSITSGGMVGVTSNVKKNQALSKFAFLMTDSTAHEPATGLTVTVSRSIDGGAFSSGALSSVTEIGSGMYYVDFSASDLNGNVILLKAVASGADTTLERVLTQP